MYSNSDFIRLFQSKLNGLGAETAIKYRRTITELDCFLTAHHLKLCEISDVMVADWTIHLIRQKLSKTTVVRHLNILNSLLKYAAEKNFVTPLDSPRVLARQLSEADDVYPLLMNERIFNDCLSELRGVLKPSVRTNIYKDIMLFSVLNGAMPFSEIAVLKKQDAVGLDEVSRMIVARNQSAKRSYVFDLKQSYRTAGQIYSDITDGIDGVFTKVTGVSKLDPDNFSKSLWVGIALGCGAAASEALGCVGGSAPYTIPEFCTPPRHTAVDKTQWRRSVETILGSDMPRWYAMHLRKGVRYEDLRKEICEKIKPQPELFYPCEIIRRQRGEKMIFAEQPFISNTIFFKTYPEIVLPMFYIIGDKAWCYRVTADARSPYAVISPRDMKRFQAAVGVFSSDMEIHPLGELTPKPGEPVIVVKAGYSNREGQVEDIIKGDCGTVIFRVKLSTDQGYEWRIDVDSSQIERILNS